MDDEPPGTRTGSRRAARPRRTVDRQAVTSGAAALAAALAWVVLVYAGIRFGQSARGGDSTGWIFMAIASLGAVACLFLALVLGSRTARLLGFATQKPVRSVIAKGGKRRR